jgi:hypothetical protein
MNRLTSANPHYGPKHNLQVLTPPSQINTSLTGFPAKNVARNNLIHSTGSRFAAGKLPRQLTVELTTRNLAPLTKELVKLNQLLAKVAPTLEDLTLIIPPFTIRDRIQKLIAVNLKKLKQLKQLTIKCSCAEQDPWSELQMRENHLLASLLLSCRHLTQLCQVSIQFPPLSKSNQFALHLTQKFSQIAKHFRHDFYFEGILNLNGNKEFLQPLQIIAQLNRMGNTTFLPPLQAIAQIKHVAKSPTATQFTLTLNTVMDLEENRVILNTAIAQLTELTGLQLCLNFNPGIHLGGEWLMTILPAEDGALVSFTPKHKLRHLTIDLSNYVRLSASQLSDFGAQLEKLPALVDLAVSFKLVREMDQLVMAKLANGIQKQSNLTCIKLTIGENYVYPELGLAHQVQNYLQTVDQAKAKELDQVKTARNWSAGLASLLSAVGSLTKLEHLELNLAGAARSIDNEFVSYLAFVLTGLPNLKRLSLNMAGCYKLNNQGLTKLASVIGDNLVNLKSLELDVTGCFALTAQGLGEVAKAMDEHGRKFISVTNPSFNCNFKHDPQPKGW